MQGHHAHLIAPLVLVAARQQRQLPGQVGGGGATRAALEPLRQLLDVVGTALVASLFLGLLAQFAEQARFLGHLADHVAGRHLAHLRPQVAQDVGEARQAVGRARRQLLQGADGLGHMRHRHVLFLRQLGQPGQRTGAHIALGRLHRPHERGVIVRVHQQPQPGQRVLHFLAFQEHGAAGQVVGNTQQLHRLFQRARLEVAAEQDAEITPRHVARLRHEGDFGGDLFRFVFAVAAFPHTDAFAVGLVAPQLLQVLMRIVGDQRVGGAQHAVGAAVVLLQLDDFQRGVVTPHLLQVFRVGTTPGVDRLIVIAHAGEVALVTGQLLEQAVLRVVGVLAFVHQQVADALTPGQRDLRVFFQDLHRQTDQVIEVDGVERGQAQLVALVDAGRFLLAVAARGGHRLFGRQAGVLRARHQVLHVLDVVGLGPGHQVLDLRSGIIGIEDREAALQADGGVFDLQELQAQRMEGADGHLVGILLAQALGHTLAHFLGRLVGEGDRCDTAGRVATTADQVGDLLHDHARLAAARTGQHQQGAFDMEDGGGLGGIETVHWRGIVAGPGDGHSRRPVGMLNGVGASGQRRTISRWPSSISTIRR